MDFRCKDWSKKLLLAYELTNNEIFKKVHFLASVFKYGKIRAHFTVVFNQNNQFFIVIEASSWADTHNQNVVEVQRALHMFLSTI